MSNPFTKQQIQERFDSLPADIQKVVAGEAMPKRLEVIGRNHGLRIDGIGVLIEYSGLIMLGLIKSKEFVRHLQEKLGISQEQAETIAIEVDEQVFSKIRESLREVQYQSTDESRFGEVETAMPSSHPHHDSALEDTATQKHGPDNLAEDSEKSSAKESSAHTTDSVASETRQKDTIDDSLADNLATADFAPSQSAQAGQSRIHDTPQNSSHTPEDAPEEIEHAINQAVEEAQDQSTESTQEVPKVSSTGLERGGVDIDFDAGETAVEAAVEARGQADAMRAHQVQDTPTPSEEPASLQGTPTQSPFGSDQNSMSEYTPQSSDIPAESSTPAPEVDTEKMKDFQTRLKERLSQEDTSKIDNDPYKESISE